jgi:hypothetical protein
MAAPKQTSHKDLINSVLFIVIIMAVGIVTLLSPKEKFSNYEKRTLAAFPSFSKESFFSGNFFKGIDSYYADHFIFRISITEIDNRIKSHLGVKDDGVMLYAESAPPQKNTAFANKPSPKNSKPATGEESARDSTTASTNEDTSQETASTTRKTSASASGDQNDFQTIKSIIVYQKRAVQIFGGSEKMIKSYAELANQYKNELGPEVSVYVMAIPSGSDFFLPESIKKNVNREKNNIGLLNTYLSPSVISVAAYDNIAKHTNEYIQFKTDHHWTGLGAYYAYQAFCKAANLNPLALGDFTKKEIPHFLGTLYYRTLSEDLKENPDQVEYYMTPHETDAYYYLKESSKPIHGKTYVEFAKGSNAYGVFLGGDYPLMKIVTDVKNGKKIVVIKDSYGNAFAPYLTSHYEEVYIIDYRHFNGDLKSLMSKNKINEILLAHNTFMLNSSYTIAREREMLHGVKSAKKENTIDIKEK